VKADALQAANTNRSKAVVILQVPEGTLDGNAASVEVTGALRVTRDAREQPTAESERQGRLVGLRSTERDNRIAARSSISA